MLQWMGGSRRKVTSSRKSTHSRQKQYFEQRKRKQQIPGLENYTDVQNKRTHYHEEPRSLDILSMINLATAAQQGYSELGVAQVDPRFSELSSAILLKKITCKYSKDLEEAGSEPGSISPKKISAVTGPQNVPAAHGSTGELHRRKIPARPSEYTSIKTDNKLNEQKEETQNEVSVLDLLGDDGPKRNSEGRSVPEAHVAFSVEGLGKVGIGTPAHSPRLHDRCYPSPPKASRRIHSSANLKYSRYDVELELNAMMHDIRVARDGSPSESICNTRGIINDDLDNTKGTMFTFLCMSPDAYENQTTKIDEEEESFHAYRRCQKEQQWNTTFGILDDNFLDEKYDAEWKNKPFHIECYPSSNSKTKRCESYDYGFGDPFSQSNRSSFSEHNRSDISAPSAPYFRHLTPEKEYNFISFDKERDHAPIEWSNFDSMFNPPAWPFLATEDSPDSMSLLSEESCSSTAVREERNYKQNLGSHSVKWQSKMKHKDQHHMNSRKKYNMEKNSADETIYSCLDKALQEKNLAKVGNYKKSMLNQWSSKAGHCSKNYSAPQEILEPECISLSKEGYTYAAVASAPSSCHRTPMETDTRSFGHKLMSEDDLFDLFPVPNLYPTTDLIHRESKSKIPFNHEPPNSFIYDNDILRQLSGPDVQLWKRATSPLGKEGCFSYSSCAGDIKKETQFPDLSKQQNVDEDREDGFKKTYAESQEKESIEKNTLSSVNGRTAVVAECTNNCSEHIELESETQEVFDSPTTSDPPEDAEETRRAMEEVPSQLERCVDDKLNHLNGRSLFPSQVSNKDSMKEKSGPESKNVGTDGGSKRETSYQVMLESYVLQLLCVQKVLMEASEKDIGKKAKPPTTRLVKFHHMAF